MGCSRLVQSPAHPEGVINKLLALFWERGGNVRGRLLWRERGKVGCRALAWVCRGAAAGAGVDPRETGRAQGFSLLRHKQRDPGHNRRWE